jgi:hypothetical protein
MTELKKTGYADRLTQAADAKKALLAKMKSKAAVQDPNFDRRHEERERELEAIRAARAAEKEAKRQEKIQAEEAKALTAAEAEQAELEARRKERKERKAAEKEAARLRKEAKRNAPAPSQHEYSW